MAHAVALQAYRRRVIGHWTVPFGAARANHLQSNQTACFANLPECGNHLEGLLRPLSALSVLSGLSGLSGLARALCSLGRETESRPNLIILGCILYTSVIPHTSPAMTRTSLYSIPYPRHV